MFRVREGLLLQHGSPKRTRDPNPNPVTDEGRLTSVFCNLQVIVMGSLYRSRHMTYCQMLVPPEAVYTCVAALGEIGKVQFRDVSDTLLFSFVMLCFCYQKRYRPK